MFWSNESTQTLPTLVKKLHNKGGILYHETLDHHDGNSATIEPETTRLKFRPIDRVDISVENLDINVDLTSTKNSIFRTILPKSRWSSGQTQYRTILDHVSAHIPPGHITAILGASGSGKTSFLNSIAHRMSNSQLQQSGSILYNGSPDISLIRSAYVLQQDILIPTLTVRETLRYAAELRLPPPTTAAERCAIVEDVILELGLKDCADTRIGDSRNKGCSGGEKRRTSLGVQLLANPSVLFLDEITTGLDSTSAFQVARTIKQLARRGRTIVMTIHSPRSEIWNLFDRIILMAGGKVAFAGPTHDCLRHFAKLGLPLPPSMNPAEHVIDLTALDNRSHALLESSKQRRAHLTRTWEKMATTSMDKKTKDVTVVTELGSQAKKAGMLRQIYVQTARTFIITFRDPMGLAASMIGCFSMAILTGWIFLKLDESQSGIRSRQGALFVVAGLQTYLFQLFELYRLSLDIQVFDHEKAEGVVGAASWLLSRRIARFGTEDLPIPLFYAIITFFMIGFRQSASQFFTYFGIVLLGHFYSVLSAIVAIALSRDFAVASLIANMWFTLQSFCSGFFVQSEQIPVYVRWLKYTAYVWYANGALITNEFIGTTNNSTGYLYDCPYPADAPSEACIQYTGRFVVEALGFPLTDWIWRPALVLFGFLLVFSLIAWILLTFYASAQKLPTQKEGTQKPLGKEKFDTSSTPTSEGIEVRLRGVSLKVEKRSFRRKSDRTATVLRPITARFRPGVLNVIMGVSGGGKTTLLNLIARRLQNTIATRYMPGGEMLFNNYIPTDDVIRSTVSYVPQSDDALLPKLTVWETLYYAARLRLPAHMSTDEKVKRAQSIMSKLGLRDCADTIVGDDHTKGISGGEKRRVSIAIQILTDSRILLLDEPTSGLDASTAASVLSTLRSLAQEGRTIILTVHQSRSTMFKDFGTVMLLARGGHSIWAGPGKDMLEYLAALGLRCPSQANPADFALDCISVNLQSELQEKATSAKVRKLIEGWDSPQGPHASRPESVLSHPARLGCLVQKPLPLLSCLPILVRRSVLTLSRSHGALLARSGQTIAFTIILTLFFAPIKRDYPGVQSYVGFVQEITGLYFAGMLQNIAVFPSERLVFDNEHRDGVYGTAVFFVTYSLLELPFEIICAAFFAALSTFVVGLPRTGTIFGVLTFVAFTLLNAGESLGLMFNTMFRSTGFAVALMTMFLAVGVIMSGILSTDMNIFLKGVNHISPVKWAVEATAAYTLKGVTFTCDQAQRGPDGQCLIGSGEQVLELYNLGTNGALKLVYLTIVMVGYRVFAYLLLVATKVDWTMKNILRRNNKT